MHLRKMSSIICTSSGFCYASHLSIGAQPSAPALGEECRKHILHVHITDGVVILKKIPPEPDRSFKR